MTPWWPHQLEATVNASPAKSESANKLAHISFNGEHIEAVQQPDGTVWVGIRRCCENLGVAFNAQKERLDRQAWAVVRVIRTAGADGKSYEMLMLRADRLPMWLATFDASRVRLRSRISSPRIRTTLPTF